jgi:hypothetical protein
MELFMAWVWVDLTMDGTMGGMTVDASKRGVILIEVFMELDRTFEQLGDEATEADYAADVIRRLSDIYGEV